MWKKTSRSPENGSLILDGLFHMTFYIGQFPSPGRPSWKTSTSTSRSRNCSCSLFLRKDFSGLSRTQTFVVESMDCSFVPILKKMPLLSKLYSCLEVFQPIWTTELILCGRWWRTTVISPEAAVEPRTCSASLRLPVMVIQDPWTKTKIWNWHQKR